MKSSVSNLLDTAIRKSDHIKCFGHSMFPVLHHEDVVYFKKINFADIQVNDIVIAKINRTYITHRVIYKGKNHLITKGDNNPSVDPITKSKNIVGRVYQIKRKRKLLHPDTIYLSQSTQYFDAITKCIHQLNHQNIPYVLLKGLILHLYYTNAHPRRRYLDYDILVDYKDHKKIDHILTQLGYVKKDDSMSSFQRRLLDKPIEVTYVKESSTFPIAVDIHFEPVFMMTQIGRLDELYDQKKIAALGELFLKNRRIVKVHNFSYHILSTAHLVAYLALHFFHHNFRGTHRLELLDAVIRKIPLKKHPEEWSEVSSLIQDFHLDGFVYGSFVTLRQYFHTPFPKSFLQNLHIPPCQIQYAQHYLKQNTVFEIKSRAQEGKQLFTNLFYLSPKPWVTKIWVFTKPIVVYMIILSAYSKISLSFLYVWYLIRQKNKNIDI